MKRTLTLLLTASSIAITTAQNWTVGVPVAFQLTEVNLWGGGCYPGADQTFYIDPSAVNGIQHIAIVTAVTPPGLNTIVPGPVAPLSVGDTIFLTGSGARSVYFPSGTGTIDLKIFAVGTPTTVGQVHPCVYSNLWLSNLGICPEGLSHGLSATCTVQPSTVGIEATAAINNAIDLPSDANAWTLRVNDAAIIGVELFNACGSRMAAITKGTLTCTWPDGIYFARITSGDGIRTERIVINR